MSGRFRRKVFEVLAHKLACCKHFLSTNPEMARAMRAAERRHAFDDISLHEEMLADTVRMNAYQQAIKRYVKPQDHVADIGTGTGILAFLAAARRPRKVYAVEHSSTMFDYASVAADANSIENVCFVSGSSHRFHPSEPIDVIIQEQIGMALFDEGMVETIVDVRNRCLRPGGHILPGKFEFYLEPVQLQEEERVPLIEELRHQGLKFPPPPVAPASGYGFREIYPRDVAFLLCEPEPVFALDLATLTLEQRPKRFSVRKRIDRRGQMDGVCMYFKAIFDADISFSTGPQAPKTHWPMLLYRTPACTCDAGEIFELQVEVPDLSDYLGWKWRVDRRQ